MTKFGIDSNMVFDTNGKSVATRLNDHDVSLNERTNASGISLESFPIQVPETDDKARIGRMIDSAKTNGKKAVIFPKGTYTQSTQLDLTGLTDLLIIGHGATINFTYATDSTSGSIKAWNITNSSGVTIEGIKINIQNRSLSKQYTGINISNSHDIVLRKVNVQNAGWMGITIFDAVDGTSYKIDMDNCNVEYCRIGIWSNANYVMIRETYVSNHWSLSTEATVQGSHPVWSNTPTDSQWYDGIIIKGQYWSIVNSTVVDNGQSGIYSGGTLHGLIIGCTINNNWNKGVDLGASRTGGISSIQYVTVEGNTVQDNKTGQIHFSKVDNSKVLGNDSLALDTGYSDTPAYVQPSIIFNNDCVGNIVQGNVVIQNLATSGIFLNSAGSKSTGNIVKVNKVVAVTKYNINYDDNLVTDQSNGTQQFLSDVQFLRRITKVLNIDLTIGGLSGFDGRNALNLNASSDNSYVQVTANKQIQFNKPDGSAQDVRVGALVSSSATLSGVNFFADTATVRLPRTSTTNEGYIWYDSTAQAYKVTLASGVVKTITLA
jgi:hypothetical protein